jgi:mRNA-degrading endonuclease toxin of MazEF toxin-antitoxin module
MRRGEIRWYTFAQPDKRRPVLLLTRDVVIESLNELIVVPATRTIRGLTTEVILAPEEGVPVACALSGKQAGVSSTAVACCASTASRRGGWRATAGAASR